MTSLLIDRIRGDDPTLRSLLVAYDFPAGRDYMCLMARPLLEDPPTPEQIFQREVEIIDFCEALSKNTSIMDIELHGWLQATDPYIRRLTAAISQMKELKHLCCAILEFRTERFAVELGHLVASLSKLEEVKIDCVLMDFDFSILASALAVHPTVKKFSLDVHVSPQHANHNFRTTFDCLGRALLSAPNLRVVELAVPWVTNRATIAPVPAPPTPPPFSAFLGDDLLESLVLRPTIKEVALFYFPLDDIACGLLCAGLEHSSLQKLTLQGCGISERNYVSIFDILQRLETLQGFRLSISIPFRTTGAIALYRFLTESKSLKRLAFIQAEELWLRRPYYIVTPTHEETHDYASYAVTRSLLINTSLRELELRCFRMETVGYLDFEASLNEDNLEDPKHAGVASLLTTVLSSKSNLTSLNLTSCLTSDNTYTLIIRSLWDNKSLLSLNTALEDNLSADLGFFFGDRESTGFDRNAILLDLVRRNRYIENIELEGTRPSDALEEMLFGAKENRLRKEREQEEILGWLHLNRKGRRDISMENTRKSRAVELLIETKENTHCAFSMLLESPSLYF
jgi:hypothetical protein